MEERITTAGVAVENGRVFVAKREKSGAIASKWEFPGGKLRRGEDEAATLRREYLEELSVPISIGPFILSHDFENKGVLYHLKCYAVRHLSHDYRLSVHTETRWVDAAELSSLDMAPSDGKIRERIMPLLLRNPPQSSTIRENPVYSEVLMEKKDIDWSGLGFGYMPTDYRFYAEWKDGKWDEGRLTTDSTITMSECAGVLQYAQTCFEGLKAYTWKDGSIVTFRPDLNAARMQDSARRLMMPEVSSELFLRALDETVKANTAWVPPYGTGATLYVRPFLFGSGPVIGVAPAPAYHFRLFCTPVGPYFKGGVKPIRICVSDYDRAAPHGTGDIKAGLNYAMSLYPGYIAHSNGYAENMFLDAATRTNVEETGGANFLFVTKDGKLVTPKSSTILPSITRRSLLYVAKEYLGIETEERVVPFDEVREFAEVGVCGTAAVISPVGEIDYHGGKIMVPTGMDSFGPVLGKLRETLTGIQMGDIEAPEGWIRKIC